MLKKIKKYVAVHKLNCATGERTGGSCTCGLESALVEIERLEKFLKLVSDMRNFQKLYFKNRLQGDLRTSKLYEGDVDKLLVKLNEPEVKPADGVQKALL